MSTQIEVIKGILIRHWAAFCQNAFHRLNTPVTWNVVEFWTHAKPILKQQLVDFLLYELSIKSRLNVYQLVQTLITDQYLVETHDRIGIGTSAHKDFYTFWRHIDPERYRMVMDSYNHPEAHELYNNRVALDTKTVTPSAQNRPLSLSPSEMLYCRYCWAPVTFDMIECPVCRTLLAETDRLTARTTH